MRLGTEVALTTALQGLGLGGAAERSFYRAGESDRPTWGGRARTPHLGHGEASSTPVGTPGVVASLLPFRTPSSIAARGARAVARTRGQADGATLSAPDAGDGRRKNPSTVDG